MKGGAIELPSSSGPTGEMFRLRRSINAWSLPRFRRILIVLVLVSLLIFFHQGFPIIGSTHEANVQADDRRLLARDSDIVDKAAVARVVPNILNEELGTSPEFVAAVLVFCASRPRAIQNHLEQLIRYRGSPTRFPIVVSQDGDASTVTSAISQLVNQSTNVFHIQHIKTNPSMKLTKGDRNYFFIAQHYKWALDHVFRVMNYSHIIVTEDDLDISKDFFSYFYALKPLLTKDPTLWCISAWNDNGGKDLTDRRDLAKLWRTDFFPGLGWMLRAETWNELRENWPQKYWDDWMRRPEVRQGRSCVRPEISRTAHNMQLAGKGSSGGLYKSYLSSITLPEKPIDFSLIDTSFLLKENWDPQFARWIREAQVVSSIPDEVDPHHSYRLNYSNAREWRQLADRFKLMNDIRSGMTRTAYFGVVPFSWKGARVYAVPTWADEEALATGKSNATYDVKLDLQSRFMDFEKQYCKPSRYSGKCDPKSPELREWFKKRDMLRKLDAFGEMIVV